MRRVIRLGDPTSHGGKVLSAGSTLVIMGIQVARFGDSVSCPHPGHANCTIAEGDSAHLVDGIPVAYENHKTTCGASLISTVPNFSKG